MSMFRLIQSIPQRFLYSERASKEWRNLSGKRTRIHHMAWMNYWAVDLLLYQNESKLANFKQLYVKFVNTVHPKTSELVPGPLDHCALCHAILIMVVPVLYLLYLSLVGQSYFDWFLTFGHNIMWKGQNFPLGWCLLQFQKWAKLLKCWKLWMFSA